MGNPSCSRNTGYSPPAYTCIPTRLEHWPTVWSLAPSGFSDPGMVSEGSVHYIAGVLPHCVGCECLGRQSQQQVYFVSFRQQGGGRYHQFTPHIQSHKGHALDEKTSTLLSASQHPLPSSSHPWHKQLGRLSISSAGGKVPGIGAKGLSLSCQHRPSPSIAALTRHAEQLLASALASVPKLRTNAAGPCLESSVTLMGFRYSPSFRVSAGIVYLTSS